MGKGMGMEEAGDGPGGGGVAKGVKDVEERMLEVRMEYEHKIRSLGQTVAALQGQLSAGAGEMDASRAERMTMLRDLESREAALAAAKQENEGLNAGKERFAFSVEALQGKVAKLVEELEVKEAVIAGREREAEVLSALNEGLERRVRELAERDANAEQRVLGWKRKLEESAGELRAAVDARDGLASEVERLREEVDGLTERQRAQGWEGRVASLQRKVEQGAVEMDALRKERSELWSLLEGRDVEVQGMKDENKKLLAAKEMCEGAVKALQAKVARLTDEADQSRSEMEDMDRAGWSAEQKSEMARQVKEQGHRESVAEQQVLVMRRKLEEATGELEAANVARDVLVADVDRLQEEVYSVKQKLKKAQAWKQAVSVLEAKVEERSSQIDSLEKERSALWKDLETREVEMNVLKEENRRLMASKDGVDCSVQALQAKLAGLVQEGDSTRLEMEEKDRMTGKLTERIAEQETQLKEFAQRGAVAEQRLNALTASLEETMEALRTAIGGRDELEAEVQQLREQESSMASEHKRLSDSWNERLSHLEQRLKESSTRLQSVHAERDTMLADLESKEAEVLILADENKRMAAANEMAEFAVKSLKAKLEQQAVEAERMKAELEERGREMVRLTREKGDLDDRLTQQGERQCLAEQRIQDLTVKLEETANQLQTERGAMLGDLESRENELLRMADEIKRLMALKEMAEFAVESLQSKLEQSAAEAERMKAELEERGRDSDKLNEEKRDLDNRLAQQGERQCLADQIIQDLKVKLEETTHQLQTERGAILGDLETKESELLRMVDENKRLTASKESAESLVISLQSKLEQLVEEAEITKAELEERGRETDRLTGEKRDLDNRLVQQVERQCLADQIIQDLKVKLEETTHQLQTERGTILGDLETKESELLRMVDENKRLTASKESAESLVISLQSKLEQLVEEAEITKAELEERGRETDRLTGEKRDLDNRLVQQVERQCLADQIIQDLKVKLEETTHQLQTERGAILGDLETKESELLRMVDENRRLTVSKEAAESLVISLQSKLEQLVEEAERMKVELVDGGREADRLTEENRDLDNRLKQQGELQCLAEQRFQDLKVKLEETANELQTTVSCRDELVSEVETLRESIHLMKMEEEKQKQAWEHRVSSFQQRAGEGAKALDSLLQEKDALLRDLEIKEVEVDELKQQNTKLLSAKESLASTVEFLQIRLSGLLDDAERSRSEMEERDTASRQLSELNAQLEKQLREQEERGGLADQQLENLKRKLEVTAGELQEATTCRDGLGEEVAKLEEKIRCLTSEQDQLSRAWEQNLGAVNRQLVETASQLDTVSDERATLLRDLEKREAELNQMGNENRQLLAAKEMAEFSVQSLQAKLTAAAEETDISRVSMELLRQNFDAAETKAALKEAQVQDLLVKIENGDRVSARLREAEVEIRDLQEKLEEADQQVRDKEDSLAASEWTVQHLASEISKAKSTLLQRDKKEANLQQQLEDLAMQLRSKEGEMIELDCFLQEQMAKNTQRKAEVDDLSQKMHKLHKEAAGWQRRESELDSRVDVLEAAVEEKDAILAELEQKLKLQAEVQEAMEGAITSLRVQLADGESAYAHKEREMERLCDDLEAAKQEATSAAEQFKDLQSRLMQLEQIFEGKREKMESMAEDLRGTVRKVDGELKEEKAQVRLLLQKLSIANQDRDDVRQKMLVMEDRVGELLALQDELEKAKALVSTLQKSVVEKDEALRKINNRLLELDQTFQHKVRELEALVIELQEQSRNADSRLQEETGKVSVLSEKLARAEQDRGDACQQVLALQELLRKAENELNEATEKAAFLLLKSSDAESGATESHEKLHAMQLALIETKNELAEQMGRNSLVTQKLVEAEGEAGDTHTRLLSVQELLAKADSRIVQETEKADALVSSLQAVQSLLLEKQVEVDTLSTNLRSAERKAAETREQMLAMQDLLRNTECDLKENRQKVLQFISSVEEAQETIERKQKELEAVNERLLAFESRAEEGQEKARIDLDELLREVAASKEREKSLEEVNQRLQLEVAKGREQNLARKDKLVQVLDQLEQNRKTNATLHMQMAVTHKRVLNDISAVQGEARTGGDDHNVLRRSKKMRRIDDLSSSSESLSDAVETQAEEIEACSGPATAGPSGSQRVSEERGLVTLAGDFGQMAEYSSEALEEDLSIPTVTPSDTTNTEEPVVTEMERAVVQLGVQRRTIAELRQEILNLRSDLQHVPPVGGTKVESGTDLTGRIVSPEEFSHHLELCDSLVRKNIALDKKVEAMERKNRGLQRELETLKQIACAPLEADENTQDRKKGPLSGENRLPPVAMKSIEEAKMKTFSESETSWTRGASERSPLQQLRSGPNSPSVPAHLKANRQVGFSKS